MTAGIDTQYVFELAGCDDQAGGGDKARDDWVAEKIGQNTETKQPHQDQDDTGQKCQCDGRRQIFSCTGQRQIAHRSGSHQ